MGSHGLTNRYSPTLSSLHQPCTYLQAGSGTLEDARKRVWMVDSKGLITTTRGDKLPEHKKAYARSDGTPDMKVCVYV